MKTISDSSDKVGSMIRQAGLEIPPPGMAERIMHRIELATLKKSPDYSPVIGNRGWIILGGSAFAMIGLFLLAGSNGESNGNFAIIADHVLRSLHILNQPFRFDFPVPKPLLFGLAGLLLLLSLDFLLTTLQWKRGTSEEQS